ncbi:MAG: SDR family oxidoreductase [Candidatus Eremiobacteraeota bacterium]|nr:SDR family oxidoreductase [Candidatus Eremiobacteraeota bacterium]MBV9409266.1 SDR family oxidoreductase [Candidatus Eremiobacteraeota bacterium]
MTRLAGKQVVVLGGSRGVGRALVAAAREAGAEVLAVGRTPDSLAQLAREVPGTATLTLDMFAPDAAERVFAALTPDVLVVNAGAPPHTAPVHEQSWEQFSISWNADVRASLAFCQAALRAPLAPGSTVVLVSSGAGLQGSQMSGGYAGAKRMQMFLAEYFQGESDRQGLGIRFLALVPARIMVGTELGDKAIAGYSRWYGIEPAAFIEQMGPAQTPAQVGAAFVDLVAQPRDDEASIFAVTAAGVEAVS